MVQQTVPAPLRSLLLFHKKLRIILPTIAYTKITHCAKSVQELKKKKCKQYQHICKCCCITSTAVAAMITGNSTSHCLKKRNFINTTLLKAVLKQRNKTVFSYVHISLAFTYTKLLQALYKKVQTPPCPAQSIDCWLEPVRRLLTKMPCDNHLKKKKNDRKGKKDVQGLECEMGGKERKKQQRDFVEWV